MYPVSFPCGLLHNISREQIKQKKRGIYVTCMSLQIIKFFLMAFTQTKSYCSLNHTSTLKCEMLYILVNNYCIPPVTLALCVHGCLYGVVGPSLYTVLLQSLPSSKAWGDSVSWDVFRQGASFVTGVNGHGI